MVWNNAVLLYLVVCLCITQEKALAQYINGNFRRSCPCQNVPVQQRLPVQLPLSSNRPITNYWAASNVPAINTAGRLQNGCPCNENTAPVYNDLSLTSRLNPQDKIALINLLTNLKNVASNLLPIAEKLSLLSNLASASRDAAKNFNVPIKKLNVPIVNDVPVGALRVARNLPMANFQSSSPIGGLLNDNVQILGRGPISYQNIPGVAVNNVPQIPVASIRNALLKNFLNLPVNNVPNSFMNNPRYSVNDVTRLYNLANLPINTIERQPIINQTPCNLQSPINNIPCNNNMPIATLKNIIERLQILNRVNQPLPIGNQIISVNPPYLKRQMNMPVENSPSLRYYNSAASPVLNRRFAWENRPLVSSDNGRVVANVPVVPYNTLAQLPAYNGLPVIKVSESVYKLTPV